MDPNLFLSIGSALKWMGILFMPAFLLPLFTLVFPGGFEKPAKLVFGLIDKLTSFALIAAIAATFALLATQLAVVVASYAFGLSWTWLSELVIYAFAAMFMLGAAVALRDDAHVRVDILRPRLGENGRNWVELAGVYLFLFPICIRLLQTGEQGLARSWLLFEGSRESDGLPFLYLFKTLVPAFAILMITQGTSVALKAALRLTGKLAPEKPGDDHGVPYGA